MQPLGQGEYTSLLEPKAADLWKSVRNRDDIAIERSADALDELQSLQDRELALSDLDRFSRLQRDIHAALARMKDDSFGTCQRCDEPISQTRLKAIPWAAFCVHCQEAADAENSTNGGAKFKLTPPEI